MHRRCEARVTALVEDLVNLGCRPVLVSGLAYGIDASAHRASLKSSDDFSRIWDMDYT